MNILKIMILGLFLVISTSANAAPEKKLWKKWQASNNSSREMVDYVKFNDFLKKYVVTGNADKINRVKYNKVTPADKKSLEEFLTEMQAVKVTGLSKKVQFVYWVNLYNATTINVILDNMPLKSIRDIGLFKSGPWDKKLLKIEGEDVTLNDIEHRILRPIWNDSRIHYLVNCASLGCPNIQNKAFHPYSIEKEMGRVAEEFVVPNRAFKIVKNSFPGKDAESLHVSSIYHWFKSDFGNKDDRVIKEIRGYMDEKNYEKTKDFKIIEDDFYDWGLNIQ